ncbi:MAG: LysR family glycine cleavage system transcriptional activator [Alteromonadaceae bacterium]|jgi:LysR family glycine cleavage system transcriptional activator
MRLPPLKSLQVFLCAAQHQSFKAAAEQLHVTQAAVSQQIRLLEDYFDDKLFERNKKHTRLNSKGKRLYPFIDKAFEQINLGISELTSESGSNELKITTLHSVASLLLIPNISDFQQKNTDLSVQFSPNNKLESFEEQNVDVAIRHGLGSYVGLESRKLTDDSIMLVASPLLIGYKNFQIENIFSLPLLEDISSNIQEAIDDCCLRFSIKKKDFKVTLKTTDALPIIQNALAGQGITFVSKVLVEQYLRTGQLINIFDYVYDNPRTLFLVAPPHHFKWDKIQRFELWLKQLFSRSL